MSYCPKCGAQLGEGVNFCPVCGANLNPAACPEEIETSTEKKVLAVFGYFTIFVLIYLAIFKQNDKFLINHANQALLACIFGLGFCIIPFLGWALLLPLLVFEIIVIVGAAQGKCSKMPLIGGIEILKYKPLQ